MIGTKILGGPATNKNGSDNNSAALALCDGSLTNILSRNRLRRGDAL